MIRCFIDVETTGLDPEKNSIVELACIINKDGEEVERLQYNIKPYHNEQVDKAASDKTGLTTETVYGYPDQSLAFRDFIAHLEKYIDGKDINNRAFFCAYNASFDMDFLRNWFKFNRNFKFTKFFYYPYLDVMAIGAFVLAPVRNALENFKLSTVYEYIFHKPVLKAHDAMADITATVELFNYFTKTFYSNIT